MKKLFKKSRCPCGTWSCYQTEADVDKAVKEIGLPMIAKPDNGVGQQQPLSLRQKKM